MEKALQIMWHPQQSFNPGTINEWLKFGAKV
jgi:hypothetical protein